MKEIKYLDNVIPAFEAGRFADEIDNNGKFQSAIARAKRCINSNEYRLQGNFELFTEHRMNKLKEDTYKQILDEIIKE